MAKIAVNRPSRLSSNAMRRDVLFVLTIAAGLLPIVTSAAHAAACEDCYAADANLRLVQAPSPRREIDLGEFRPSDSPRCRQAKEDVKVLDGPSVPMIVRHRPPRQLL